MRGVLTKLILDKYGNSENLHFYKWVHESKDTNIVLILDLNRHKDFIDSKFPYIFRGLSYDIYGEFSMKKREPVKDGDSVKHYIDVKIVKLDKIEINT